ncbi:uncharacterized protein MELLADRAFT_86185 [Melampsora larici-populina 98AG31]|uniref:Uncharacterized protein n=1 Tax=Melampsora larici-populina (strain 98AG31 / pathotype 3-4-7) TaxID=747676 RepID=F4RKV4_MELLP|nr:uncharacterized protein MELLADRAFT_86185 [Melampsora larici-populina 98AG31]EGG06972.1 hypothetical protein MELLADRAFT_86185 [Melampsora larici-populina 98AG31]
MADDDIPMSEATSTTTPVTSTIPPATATNPLADSAIVGGLQTQIVNLSVGTSAKKDKNRQSSSSTNPYTTPSTSRTAPRQSTSATKTSKSTPKSTSKSTPKSNQKTKKSPEAPRKRHVLQVFSSELASDFKSTKEALYIHIKMMWGLFKKNDVPPPPNPALLKEFYLRFSNSDEIDHAIKNPTSADVVAQGSIMTLRSAKEGQIKLGRGLANISNMQLLYIHGVLARVGIRIWAPDLNDAYDSLYNNACRMVALDTFRQLLSCGSYNYMNANMKHVNSMSDMIAAYNHYVHFLKAGEFRAESKTPGRKAQLSSRKTIQKNRERISVKSICMDNRHKYGKRYQDFVAPTAAHSDDEENPDGSNTFTIKTLGYRSPNANKFMRRLDYEMKQAGYGSNMRVRRLPKWHRSLPAGRRRRIGKRDRVTFLPDASRSLMKVPHPDELLSDSRFTAKYLDIIKDAYQFSDDEDHVDAESEDEEESEDEDAIDIDAPPEDDESSEFYSDGEYGDLYDEEEVDDSGKGKGKGKATVEIEKDD